MPAVGIDDQLGEKCLVRKLADDYLRELAAQLLDRALQQIVRQWTLNGHVLHGDSDRVGFEVSDPDRQVAG